MSFMHEIYLERRWNSAETFSFSEGERTVLVECEGEIHNVPEIRERLRKSGSTIGDDNNQLISEAYSKWGEGCFREFNGAFGFYIFDKMKKN